MSIESSSSFWVSSSTSLKVFRLPYLRRCFCSQPAAIRAHQPGDNRRACTSVIKRDLKMVKEARRGSSLKSDYFLAFFLGLDPLAIPPTETDSAIRYPRLYQNPLLLTWYSTILLSNQLGMNDLSLIHISEPTRRTPISYAVFCLKKKKKIANKTYKNK